MTMTAIEIMQRQEALLIEMVELTGQLRANLVSPSKAPDLAQKRHPIPPELVGTRWSEQVARGAVGVLVRHASGRRREQLTYTDLHHELVAAGAKETIGKMQKYAKPLHRICVAFDKLGKSIGLVVPLLTVLVVNGRTGQPSQGLNVHLERWLEAAGHTELAGAVEAEPQTAIDLARQAAMDFNNWHDVLTAAGLTGDPATDMARPF